MQVLVTGATGFVGGNLARELWHRGYRVRALVRAGSDTLTIRGTDIHQVEGDLLDRESLSKAMADCEAVFHCAAAYTFWSRDPQKVRRTNVEGTVNVLECARDAGVERVVYTSTVSTIGVPEDGSLGDESTPLSRGTLHGHYKQSKFDAEKEAMRLAAEGVPVVVVNPTTPVGPWDVKPTPTGKIILDFLRRRIPAYLATGMNLVDVADVCAGHITALERGRIGQRYILGNRNVTLKELFAMLSQITGLSAPRVRLPYWLVVGAGYAEQAISAGLLRREPLIPVEGVLASRKPAWVSSQRAITELELPQSPVEGALEKAAEWYAANGYVRNVKDGARS
jgi:dihydroflavonol-4-reductase